MFKILALISLVVVLQVNSLEVPRLYVLQDLVKFSSEVKDIIRNINFQNESLTEENNPIIEIVETINQISENTKNITSVNRSVDNSISFLTTLYELFLSYAFDLNNYNDDTINEFIDIVTIEAPDHVSEHLEVLESDDVWESILAIQNEAPDSCGAMFTQQMNMYLLHEYIMIIKLKTLVLSYGAYNFRSYNSSIDAVDESDNVEETFATTTQKYMQQLKEILPSANREVFICDSGSHVLDEDYVELEGLFSNVVINQYEIGRKPRCGDTCSQIESSVGSKRCGISSYDEKNCPLHPCQGMIYDCGWIGGDVDVCEKSQDSRKRYEWVRSYGNDARYGQWTACNNGKYYEYRTAYYRLSACSTCFCKCSENLRTSNAIRTLSFLPQMSNIEENKVVSNVRFVSHDNMIHVQIAETPLLPLGRIDNSQDSWVPLGNFSYNTNETSASFTSSDGTDLEENKDFGFVNFNEKTLYLDQITAESGYVMTGVRFNYVRNEEESKNSIKAFQIEINVTPFDFATGQLNPTEENPSQWISGETQPNPPEIYGSDRRAIDYGGRSYKYDPFVMHTTVVAPNKYVIFDSSSLHSDGGQSTVPFFDARPIDSENSLAFNGLGLVYRSADEFVGLIAFELFTIDISMQLDPN